MGMHKWDVVFERVIILPSKERNLKKNHCVAYLSNELSMRLETDSWVTNTGRHMRLKCEAIVSL